MSNYWNKVMSRRIGRRRALIATGGFAAGAAFLAACGGDDSPPTPAGPTEPPDPSGLLHQAVDTTDSAVRGGTWTARAQDGPQNFDLYNFDPFSQGFANVVGTKLVTIKPARMQAPTSFDIVGDGAEGWEISPDRLTVTFKMHPGAKYSPFTSHHQGAPSSIENRRIDAEDVMFSWSRFTEISSNASEFASSRNPAAPIDSLEAPDAGTVVMHLNKPYSPLLTQLANGSVSYFYIIPKEGAAQDTGFFNRYQFGGGPFMIENYEPSVKLDLVRNSNYEAIDYSGLKRPFVDKVEFIILPDFTASQAQFRAGRFLTPPPGVQLEEMLQLKRDFPELLMWATPDSVAVTEWFGMAANGHWKDQRVRQAVQYSWDRDLFIDVFFSVDKLEEQGIAANKRWNTAIPCGGPGSYMYFPGMWLDPQGAEFGENAKYFTLGSRDADIAEAKKLLSAAGHPNGIRFKHIQYPLGFGQQPAQDIIEGMMMDVGLEVTEHEQIRIPEIFSYIFGGGNFEEMLNTVDFGGPDVGAFLHTHYHPTGNLFGGWNPDDTGVSAGGDPFLTETVEKVLAEFDHDVRVQLVHEFQRYMAKMFYYSRYPGGATTLSLAWPAVQNWNVYRGGGLSNVFTYEWLDQTKRPFA